MMRIRMIIVLLLFVGGGVGTIWADDIEINKIHFDGNESFSDKQLRSLLRRDRIENYSERHLRADESQIIEFYQQNGFLNARITKKTSQLTKDGQQVELTLTIAEGEQTRFGSVRIAGQSSVDSSLIAAKITIKPGDLFSQLTLDSQRQAIINIYAAQGYAYATVRDSLVFSPDRTGMDVIFQINEGTKVFIKSIEVTGLKTIEPKVVFRELASASGNILNFQLVQEDQQRLYATGLFRDVRVNIPDLDSLRTEVTIEIEVREEKLRWIGGGIGYGNLDGIRLSAEYGHNNLFGSGETGKIETIFSQTDLFRATYPARLSRRVDMEYVDPRFFDSTWSAGINPFYDYQDNLEEAAIGHKIESIGTTVAFGRVWKKNNQVSLKIGWRSDNYFDLLGAPLVGEYADEISSGRTITNTYTVAVSRDTRNDIFNTTRGYFMLLSGQVGGFLFKNTNHFIKWTIDTSWHQRVGFGIIALRFNGGLVNPYRDSAIVEVSDQFTYGGSTTNRGYKDRRLGPVNHRQSHSGNALLAGSLETRFPFLQYFQMVLFGDFGRLWYTNRTLERGAGLGLQNDPNRTRPILSAGMGLRYFTPVGPLRLDVGFGLNDGIEKSQGHLHISFGQAF